MALTCRGGVQYTHVGVTIDYSYSTDGKRTSDKTLRTGGTPYWGLYRITYFPYNFGAGYTIEVAPILFGTALRAGLSIALSGNPSSPQVVHNKTRVPCYFNTEVLCLPHTPHGAFDSLVLI